MLEFYRDDGPIAAAIGAAAGGRPRVPAIALLLVAALPGLVAIVVEGDGASHGVVAGAIAWAVLFGGLASGRPLVDRLRWMVPSALRVIEYGGLLWIATVAGDVLAAGRLRAAVRDHLPPLRRRLRVPPPRRPAAALGAGGRRRAGTGGCCSALVLLVAGALPAGFYVMAVAVAALFIGVTIAQWRHIGRGERPVYDDEEDEDD